VVYLQEVVADMLDIIRKKCDHYWCIIGRLSTDEEMVDGEYFVVILLRKDSVKFVSHEVLPFYSSRMGRVLLKVQVVYHCN